MKSLSESLFILKRKNMQALRQSTTRLSSTRTSSLFATRNVVARRFYSQEKSDRSETIGFIGLGQMGYHMATNLYRKTTAPFIIHDINKSLTEKFIAHAQSGATGRQNPSIQVASSPAELAERASTVITMLPASPHVQEVYLGNKGLIHGIDNKSFMVDSSTIDVAVSNTVAEEVKKKGGEFLDAPVSGGVLGAEAATLTFMVGSSDVAAFERAKAHLLDKMGKNVVRCGANGTGLVAKICNNMLLGISMLGVCEAMNLGIAMGMDPKVLAGIINTSSGRCWSSDTYNPVPNTIENNPPANRDYQGGFGTSLMAKDLRLSVNAAQDVKAPISIGEMASQIYNKLEQTEDLGKLDFSVYYKWLDTVTKAQRT